MISLMLSGSEEMTTFFPFSPLLGSATEMSDAKAAVVIAQMT